MQAVRKMRDDSKVFSLKTCKTKLPFTKMRNSLEETNKLLMTININGLNSFVKRVNGYIHLTNSYNYSFLNICVYISEIIYVNVALSFKCQVSCNFLRGSLEAKRYFKTL